jgi:hypothetical protein
MKFIVKMIKVLKDSRVDLEPERSRSFSLNLQKKKMRHFRSVSDPISKSIGNIQIGSQFWRNGRPLHVDFSTANDLLLERWIIQYQEK